MADETKVAEAVSEIKNASEAEIRQVIEKWFESTRTAGMKIGAQMMSAGVMTIIQKHTHKSSKISMRDYERMTAEIIKFISVQLTRQNDSGEENDNDGTTEQDTSTNS